MAEATVYFLICLSAATGPIECGQYSQRQRCLDAGPYISRVTSIEFHVPRMRWRCEER